LDEIADWIYGERQRPIYILYGIAGIGKSTVAKTLAERAAARRILGSSFFFSRDEHSRKTAKSFFQTVAYQLAHRYSEFAVRINKVLEEDRNVAQRDPQRQFDLLIREPLLIRVGREPILIVIDALDECKSQDAELILTLLSQNIQNFAHLKVFITARPEQHIRNALDEYHDHEQFHLHDIEDSVVAADIRQYLEFRLSEGEVQKALRSLRPPLWQPTAQQTETLVGMAGKLFIVASTATSFILDRHQLDPGKQIALLLNGVSSADFPGSKCTTMMDHMYMQIIKAAQPDPIGDWVDRFQVLVGTIVLLHDPLPCEELARLIGVDVNDVLRTLTHLHSILAPTGQKQVFRIHHKSFPDFITDPNRCQPRKEFFISATAHHLRIAQDCFHVMDRELRPNICQLTSNEWYEDRARLHDRIQDCISPHLAYACTYWASHLDAGLENTAGSGLEMRLLGGFALNHLLTWMEALSAIGRVDVAYPSLDIARRIVRLASLDKTREVNMQDGTSNARQPSVATIEVLFSDMCRLIQRSSETLRLSPLNIYHSALPFMSHNTALFKTYKTSYAQRVDVVSGSKEGWDTEIAILRGHSDEVRRIVFSPEGSRLASASGDGTVRLWDGRTGARVATHGGHSSELAHIIFSPDGSILASACQTMAALWDGTTGAHIANMWRHDYPGLTGHVTSIEFSPDGSDFMACRTMTSREQRILRWTEHSLLSSENVSRQTDSHTNILGLWNGRTGVPVPIGDFPSGVTSVKFSPDGTTLALASAGKVVQFWDRGMQTRIATLEGHSDHIISIAFSHDSSRFASASWDGMVYLWDGRTGTRIAILKSRSSNATSIVFSPNSLRLASTYVDGKVWLWDGNTGAPIAILNDHCSSKSSPDCLRLTPPSLEETIDLWDESTGDILAILAGYSSLVRCMPIAFSPDGSRLASVSGDIAIQLWDGRTGVHIDTLEGHSEGVTSIVYVPDGSRIASASVDRTVRLWEGRKGTLEGHPRADAATSIISPSDGSSPASTPPHKMAPLRGSNSISSLWDDGDDIYSIAFSPGGSRFISESKGGTVRLWNGRTGAHVANLEGHPRRNTSFTFSPDWSTLALRSDCCGSRLLDGDTGNRIAILEDHSGAIAFSPDGSRLAMATTKNVVQLWEDRMSAHIATLGGHSLQVKSVIFSPNSALLASESPDVLQLWDARTGVHIATLKEDWVYGSIAFSPDSSRLAETLRSTIRLWDGGTGAHIVTLQCDSSRVVSITFSPDGSILVSKSVDDTIQLWNGHTGAHIATLMGEFRRAMFSADSSQIVLLSRGRTVHLSDSSGAVPHLVIREKIIDQFFVNTLNYLYLLKEREEPPLSGLAVVKWTDQGLTDTPPCCWFPPDIIPTCLAVNPSGSIVVVGCRGGRVLFLDMSNLDLL